jgi:hypothetical protein
MTQLSAKELKEIPIETLIIEGSNHRCTLEYGEFDKPMVIRGVAKKRDIARCRETNRDFYYTDTGYFGNFKGVGNPTGIKIWHRIVKNDLQQCTLRAVPSDRWESLVRQDSRLKWKGWKNYDKKILLVVPNPKACKAYGIDYESWVTTTQQEIKKYSNLPIEVRYKASRRERNNELSIYDTFDTGVYATVTFNSIAALESVLYGIPAFISVPCAASPLASTDLSKLNSPFKPDVSTILKQCHNLAYGQFTLEEMHNGTAWKILNTY